MLPLFLSVTFLAHLMLDVCPCPLMVLQNPLLFDQLFQLWSVRSEKMNEMDDDGQQQPHIILQYDT